MKGIRWKLDLHKKIANHVDNVESYINDYLLREDTLEMQEGCGSRIDMFLGYFFIHKCMWSTPASEFKSYTPIAS